MLFCPCLADLGLIQDWREQEEEEGMRAGRGRNCLTVCCGVTGMMLFTNILMLVTVIYVFIIIQSTSDPLVRDLS